MRIGYLIIAAALGGLSVCSAQQPQTQIAPTSAINAKYVNGVAPGYAPTAGSGLTLNLGGGTANCAGTIEQYAASTLTMTASMTNYVYLNTAALCVPAVKTTIFTTADIPIAAVVTSGSAITAITDDRTLFNSGTGGTLTSVTGTAPVVATTSGSSVNVSLQQSTQTVSVGSNTNIQTTITNSGSTDNVEVPFSYPYNPISPDTSQNVQNPESVPIDDQRSTFKDNTNLQLATLMDRMDGVVTSANLGQFRKCIAAGVCKIAIASDSIGAPAAAALEQGYPLSILKVLQKKFPEVAFTLQNFDVPGCGMGQLAAYADTTGFVGGTSEQGIQCSNAGTPPPVGYYYFPTGNAVSPNWPSGSTVGQSWLNAIKSFAPDVFIIAVGINDVGASSYGFIVQLSDVVSYTGTWTTPPSVVISTENTDTQFTRAGGDWATWSANNSAIYAAERSYAYSNGIALMDVDRIYEFMRDGTDVARNSFQQENGTYPWIGSGTPGVYNCPSSTVVCWQFYDSNSTSNSPVNSDLVGGSSITVTNGSTQPAVRMRLAQDFTWSGTFSALTLTGSSSTSSVPVVWYRIATAAQGQSNPWGGYAYELQMVSTAANQITFELYYAGYALTSGVCTISGTSFNAYVRAQGAEHQAFCNGALVYDYFDYWNLTAGYSAVGIKQYGGTISNIQTQYGLPEQLTQKPAYELSMLGVYTPSSETGGTDWTYNPYSIGGDGIHHNAAISYDTIWTAAFMPVLKSLTENTLGAQVATSFSVYGTNNNGGIHGGYGFVDLWADASGIRFLSPNGTTMWGVMQGGFLTWDSFIQSPLGSPLADATNAYRFTNYDHTKIIYTLDTINNRFLFGGNQVLTPQTLDPTSPQAGEVAYRSDLGRIEYYDYATTAWQKFMQLSDVGCTAAPTGTPSSTTFLRGDCSWATPASGGLSPTGATTGATSQSQTFTKGVTIGPDGGSASLIMERSTSGDYAQIAYLDSSTSTWSLGERGGTPFLLHNFNTSSDTLSFDLSTNKATFIGATSAGAGSTDLNGSGVPEAHCLADGTGCPPVQGNWYWSIQPTLFSTGTMLGPVYYLPQSVTSTVLGVVRFSGTISCTVAPEVDIMDLGTSPSTSYGSATRYSLVGTGTSDGVYVNGGAGTLVAGHYFGLAFDSGTCVTPPTVDVTFSF
jgi:hypothetical protein